MSPPYTQAGVTLARDRANDPKVVAALQRDLRAAGYLGGAIDGAFGEGTRRAVCALQFDLLNPPKPADDGSPPVSIAAYNKDDVTKVTGEVDAGFAACLAAIITDPKYPKLPEAEDPATANAEAMKAIAAARWTTAPMPFIAAMVKQESGARHYSVPQGANTDAFVIVGLDRNEEKHPDRITSRGYGIGQYTLFHHPPTAEEVTQYITDPVRNAGHAFAELRNKFDHFLRGKTPNTVASDRKAEHPLLDLRLCRYAPTDARYMRDCTRCAQSVPTTEIRAGTPFHTETTDTYQPTQYYASATYHGVPNRAAFLCDWPYAVRRYNGGGVNSYHYQTKILLNLAAQSALGG